MSLKNKEDNKDDNKENNKENFIEEDIDTQLLEILKNVEEYKEEDYESLDLSEYKKVEDNSVCMHINTEFDKGEKCLDCGLEIMKDISLEPEWRYYGDGDSKHELNPSRCYMRKTEDKNIFKDLEPYNLPLDINKETNRRYLEITKGEIRRGKIRKSIIYACVINSYKESEKQDYKFQNPEEIREKFTLTKKEASKGLNYYNLNKVVKKKKPIYISPISFIPRIMKKFNSDETHLYKVQDLYNKIYNRSKILNRCNQQSIIAGLIFYYFKLISCDITCQKYSKIVNLSSMTIEKIANTISEILKTKNKVKII